MGQGMGVSLGDPRGAATLEECLEAELVDCLVRQAGLVMLAEKPAAVFCFRPRAWGGDASEGRALATVRRLLSVYGRLVRAFGARLVWLAHRDGGTMLLLWRPRCVEEVLGSEGCRAFLGERGLDAGDPEALMSRLVARLRAYYAGSRGFPHEVGLVMGYPLDDVRGFMADGGRGARACGRWRSYGDPLAARRRFEELDLLERRCKRLYAEGVPMGELLRMGAA